MEPRRRASSPCARCRSAATRDRSGRRRACRRGGLRGTGARPSHSERHGEPHLRTVHDGGRKPGRTARRRSVFASSAAREARRNPPCEREDVAVEEHGAHLERNGHARTVDLREDPRSERRLHVEVAHRVDEADLLRRGVREMRTDESWGGQASASARGPRAPSEVLGLPAGDERGEQELRRRLAAANRAPAKKGPGSTPRAPAATSCVTGRGRRRSSSARRARSAYFGSRRTPRRRRRRTVRP